MPELVVALDYSQPQAAVAMVERLSDRVSWFKVGLELFIAAGGAFVRQLTDMGCKIFLDLKLYDIPNTAAKAALAAAMTGAKMLTIHCQGGERMCKAVAEAVDSLDNGRPLIAGVTVLTSFGPGEMPGICALPEKYALELASLAVRCSLDAIVCSGREVSQLRAAGIKLPCVCPGIRPKGCDAGDQSRVITPGEAVANGADFLVVGRPVTAAANPEAVVAALMQEMSTAPVVGQRESGE